MNPGHATARPQAGQPAARTSDQKAYETLERLLAALHHGKITGEAYLRISANQGGVTKAKFAIEGD